MMILRNIIGFVLLSLLVAVCNKEQNESLMPQAYQVDKAEKIVLEISNELGYSYFSRLVQTKSNTENLIISPTNAIMAFNLLFNITETKTKQQIKQFLRINHLEDSSVTEGFDRLNHLFARLDAKTKIESLNQLAIGDGLNTNSSLQKFLNQRDYLQIIAGNEDVPAMKKSGHRAFQVINSQNIEAEVKFQKGIKDLPFYNTPDEISFVKMLATESVFNQYTDPTIEAVELPLGRGNFNLLMLIPQGSQTVSSIARKLNNRLINRIKSKFKPKPLEVYLPLLEMYDVHTYTDFLKQNKLQNCFSENRAGFSCFSNAQKAYLSEFKQVVNFNLKELSDYSPQPGVENKKSMLVDRPFLFIIYEKYSEAVILIGKISGL